ncbi:MAG TPA: nucleotidyltransferase [Actinomycetota bacterium]
MQTDDTLSSTVRDDHEPRGDVEFHQTLDEAIAAMRGADVRFLIIGGIASAVMGRDRGTRDVDLFVRPEDARRALEALDVAGFDTKVAFPHWLYKGFKRDVLVDVIFRSSKDVLLDDEMLRRAQQREFRGRLLPIAPPEDLLIMKAVAADEDTPRYWYDALGIIAHADGLDWDYLVRRARQHGVRRILSLLIYAQSNDLVVPIAPIAELMTLGGYEAAPAEPAKGGHRGRGA